MPYAGVILRFPSVWLLLHGWRKTSSEVPWQAVRGSITPLESKDVVPANSHSERQVALTQTGAR